jgi:hypothetical protein
MVVLVPLIGGAPASAQPQGRITGIVRDAPGAGIPGVTVTATNQATRDSHTASTAGDGSYSFSLAPGSSQVTASVPGFRTATQAIEVAADASKQLDFSLEGAATEALVPLVFVFLPDRLARLRALHLWMIWQKVRTLPS